MKKFVRCICTIMSMLLMLVVCGCETPARSTSDSQYPSADDEITPMEEQLGVTTESKKIEKEIKGSFSEMPYTSFSVKEDGGVLKVVIGFSMNNVPYFGNYIIETKDLCNELIREPHNIYAYLSDGTNIQMSYSSDDECFGFIYDMRSGTGEFTEIKTVEDLLSIFPSAITSVKSSEYTKEEAAMYNDIWAALNSDYTTPEDEIFQKLAPSYNMTPYEIRDFLWSMNKRVYQGATKSEADVSAVYSRFLGTWERFGEDDVYSGLTIDVKREGMSIKGTILFAPDAMIDAGFSVGEEKWTNAYIVDSGPDGTVLCVTDLGKNDKSSVLHIGNMTYDKNADVISLTFENDDGIGAQQQFKRVSAEPKTGE